MPDCSDREILDPRVAFKGAIDDLLEVKQTLIVNDKSDKLVINLGSTVFQKVDSGIFYFALKIEGQSSRYLIRAHPSNLSEF